MKPGNNTIGDAISYITGLISDLYPYREALAISKTILSHITGLNSQSLLASTDDPVSIPDRDKINKICIELKQSRPIQYIIGATEFYGINLKVNENVLIPRTETEEMVDLIIKENRQKNLRIIEIGTGSGCIAISLALNMDNPQVSGMDISEKALKTASENAHNNDCNINFFCGDITKPDIRSSKSYDIIVSNPPYVRKSEKALMHRNVTDYEPEEALFVSDDDPLLFYRHIINYSTDALTTGGRLYFEVNEAFGFEVKEFLDRAGYSSIRIVRDINEKDRIVAAIRL